MHTDRLFLFPIREFQDSSLLVEHGYLASNFQQRMDYLRNYLVLCSHEDKLFVFQAFQKLFRQI